ncbi:hypothetical protein diail_6894 [Diaporthe ilicicola]|nr:hypothetical protein diail_6894 [Diaporthe ilicicola]
MERFMHRQDLGLQLPAAVLYSLHLFESCLHYEPKASDYRSRGVRLSVWVGNSSSTAQYCCGDADSTQTNSSLACVDGNHPFQLQDATPVLGVAGLSNAQAVSSANSTSAASGAMASTAGPTVYKEDCASQQQDTVTIGAVLGVSLVAAAIALAVWAVWERRQKVVWWQRAIGLAPQWPPENAPWMRVLNQKTQRTGPPPCPVARVKLACAAHQQKRSPEQQPAQPAPTCGLQQPEANSMTQTHVSSPQSPREMGDGMPAAAEMDAT